MIVVINAGGSGTRLWPLSVPEYPKHLLKITGEDSLMQDAYKRAKKLTDHIYIVTEAGHAHHVKEQLPELPDEAFIIEPARRGTAGCIVAGLHHIQSRHDNAEPIAFLQADHVIRDTERFVQSFERSSKASKEHDKVTLIGIVPTGPSSAFGYIHKSKQLDENLFEVEGFTEKPERKLAEEYLASGDYLWNGGYFVGSVATFENALKRFSPKWHGYYQSLLQAKTVEEYEQAYLALESDAIDYALLEVDPELLVVPASFDWMDVGSFSDIHAAVEVDNNGNHINATNPVVVDSRNNLIINQDPNKPIGVVGLEDIVVINTEHGLLVAHKEKDQGVKEVANSLKKQADS